eukprot:1146156-Karenia_brevis.AAC.1
MDGEQETPDRGALQSPSVERKEDGSPAAAAAPAEQKAHYYKRGMPRPDWPKHRQKKSASAISH